MSEPSLEQQLQDRDNIYYKIIRTMNELLFVHDIEGRFIFFQAPSSDRLYLSPDLFIGKRPEDVMPLAVAQKFTNAFLKCKNGEIVHFDYSMPGEKGALQFSARLSPLIIDGQFKGAVSISRDITKESFAAEQMRVAEIVYSSTIEGIVLTDVRGDILSVNPAFTNITGYEEGDVVGKNPRVLKSDRHPSDFYEEMWAKLLRDGFWRGEIWNRRKTGETYSEFLSINAIKDDSGELKYYLGVFSDISFLKQREEKMIHQAYHDPLTDLPNRALFHDRVKVAIRHAVRAGRKLAVTFMDLDYFKQVNDTYGHIVGDYLLQDIAKRLKRCIREEDTLARVGGDEFVFLLTDVADEFSLVQFTNRVLELFSQPFIINGNECNVTASLGVSLFPDDGMDEADLLNKADMAMYYAKRNGRNNFQFFSKEIGEKINSRIELEKQLRKAERDKAFELYYQPVYSAQDMRIVGCEALLRWRFRENELVMPDDFVPLAEEIGLILPIGEWVIEEALATLGRWHSQGLDKLKIMVNISASQVARPDFCTIVEKALKKNKIAGQFLTLELTEDSIMKSATVVTDVVSCLHEMGVTVSIDDFGTGYSSLSYLKQFAVDSLKIDGAFVREVATDPKSASIVRAIVALADSLGLTVVGEGVETPSQLDFLKEVGCHRVQGFHLSVPVSVADIEAILG